MPSSPLSSQLGQWSFLPRCLSFCFSKLSFLVDESLRTIENYVPPMFKQAPTTARSVAADIKSAGVMGTASGLAKSVYSKCEPAAKGVYSKYEPVAEGYATSVWLSFNRISIVPKVTQAVVPTATYYSGKYK